MTFFLSRLCRPQDDTVAFMKKCVLLFVFIWLSTKCWSNFYQETISAQGVFTEEGQYGKITQTDEKWVLIINLGIGAKTSVKILNQQVSFYGRYRENGEWKGVTERYSIPSEYKRITSKSFLGKVIVTARKCTGDCKTTRSLWPFGAKLQANSSHYFNVFKLHFKFPEWPWTPKTEPEL